MPSAEKRLADLWGEAKDRQAFTNVVDEIEARLKTRPLSEGESREAPFRVTYQAGVGLLFAVSEGNRLVSVVRIWTV